APVLEHAEGVAGAVPQSEHYVAAVQGLSARKHHTFYPSPFDDQVGNPALEAYFATQRDDLFAHLRYAARQAKRADVRLADLKNFRRCTGAHELPHHLAAVEFRVFYLAVELAIGEHARAALAKLDVGFRCQRVFPPERPGVACPASYITAAFQYDGPEAHLREQERREESAGAEPDDQRPLLELRGGLGDRVIARVR